MNTHRGFTLIELMIVIAIVAVIAAIAIPGLLNSQRASNERNASASLKTIAVAQADFRSNDRDLNRITDYWTRDIAGLYAIDNASVAPGAAQAIKLIELSIALADQNPSPGGQLTNGNYGTSIAPTFGAASAKAGYWYRMLDGDAQAVQPYPLDTDGTGDMVHNTSRFGAGCMPESYGSSGNVVFIVNEGNAVYKRDFGQDVLTPGATPPALSGAWAPVPLWPTNADLAALWAKMD